MKITGIILIILGIIWIIICIISIYKKINGCENVDSMLILQVFGYGFCFLSFGYMALDTLKYNK